MKYLFDRFVFDVDRFELTDSDGERVKLGPRALELLLLLLRSPGKLIDKETLVREIWGRTHLSRSALPSQVHKVRRALGDTSEPYKLLQAVPRRGLRFVGTVKAENTTQSGAMADPRDLALRDEAFAHSEDQIGKQPSIAVLPFTELKEGDQLQGLSKALPSDIILSLSRLKLFSVISRGTSFWLGQLVEVDRLALTNFGFDYILEGAVARIGDEYSIFTQLFATENAEVIWADRFEVEPRDIHGTRDRIVNAVRSQIEKGVARQEARSLHLDHPDSLTAWQAFHVGSWLTDKKGPHHLAVARTYLNRAVEIDPSFARAWSGLAGTYMVDVLNHVGAERKQALSLMLKTAEKAYLADPDDPSANVHLGWASHAIHSGQSPKRLYQHSIEIAPSYAPAHHRLGGYYAYTGDGAQADKKLSRALSLNPYGLDRYAYFRDLAVARLLQGRMQEAIELGCKAGRVPFDDLQTLLVALVSNHLSDRKSEAQALSQRVHQSFPGVTWSEVYGTNMASERFEPMIVQILAQYGLANGN